MAAQRFFHPVEQVTELMPPVLFEDTAELTPVPAGKLSYDELLRVARTAPIRSSGSPGHSKPRERRIRYAKHTVGPVAFVTATLVLLWILVQGMEPTNLRLVSPEVWPTQTAGPGPTGTGGDTPVAP